LYFILKNGYIKPEQIPSKIQTDHPLRRYDERYSFSAEDLERDPANALVNLSWIGKRERMAVRLRETRPDLTPDLDQLMAKGEDLIEFLGLSGIDRPGIVRENDDISVSISVLRDFLCSPIQGWARYVLRLSEEDEEPDETDGLFDQNSMNRVVLMRNVIRQFLDRSVPIPSNDKIKEAYEEAVLIEKIKGRSPPGFFGSFVENENLKNIINWHDVYRNKLAGNESFSERFVGNPDKSTQASRIGPIVLEIPLTDRDDSPTIPVKIKGNTNPISEGKDKSLLFVSSGGKIRDIARCFIDILCLATDYLRENPGMGEIPRTYQCCLNTTSWVRIRTYKIKPNEAKAYLTHLIFDLLRKRHDHALSIEAVEEWYKKDGGKRTSLAAFLDDYLNSETSRKGNRYNSNGYGSLKKVESRYPPPAKSEVDEVWERRFSLFFERGKEK
ncbi:MAG: hypothetical protein HQK54_06440, partial [Oligoflexales bacterium]|nr:hypothetical protein [Oligoflexales bacterium]